MEQGKNLHSALVHHWQIFVLEEKLESEMLPKCRGNLCRAKSHCRLVWSRQETSEGCLRLPWSEEPRVCFSMGLFFDARQKTLTWL